MKFYHYENKITLDRQVYVYPEKYKECSVTSHINRPHTNLFSSEGQYLIRGDLSLSEKLSAYLVPTGEA